MRSLYRFCIVVDDQTSPSTRTARLLPRERSIGEGQEECQWIVGRPSGSSSKSSIKLQGQGHPVTWQQLCVGRHGQSLIYGILAFRSLASIYTVATVNRSGRRYSGLRVYKCACMRTRGMKIAPGYYLCARNLS